MPSVQDDRAAWLADAVRVPPSAPTEATGAWSQRLSERGAPDLAHVAAALRSLADDVREQQTALTSKLSAQMNVARTVASEAADEAEHLARDTQSLRAALEHTQHTLVAKTPASGTAEAAALAELHRLAQVKHRMQAARDTLRASESWSSVESEVDGHLAQGDWERAALRLVGMEQTLSHFDASSEYVAAKRMLLNRLLDTLDEAVAGALATAVRAEDTDAVVRCARVYTSVHRAPVFVARYTELRTQPLSDAWDAAPDRVAGLCAALCALADAERGQLAPRLFQDVNAAVDVVLTAAAERLPLRAHVERLASPATFPALVQAYSDLAATCKAIAAPAAHDPTPDAPIPLDALPPARAWRAQVLGVFAPHQAVYGTLEAAHLEHAFEATRAAFEARRDRAYVQTADRHPGAWAACMQDMAVLSRDQVDACVELARAASERAQAFAHGADVLDVLQDALLPALSARLGSAWEQVRARHAQHIRAQALSDPAQLLAEDMDPIPDWDVVHASVQVMQIGPRLDTALHTLQAALLAHAAHDAAALERLRAHTPPLVAPPALARAAHALVLAQLLSAFRVHLEAYSTHGQIYAPPTEQKAEVHIPSFSRSPTEAMVKLGEGLLNLPRLLETLVERELRVFSYEVDALPYAHDDAETHVPPQRAMSTHRALSMSLLTHAPDARPTPTAAAPAEAATDGAPTAYTAEHVLSLWLRSLTSTLLVELQGKLPRMARDARCDRAQLAADVEYLGTIASALNASSPELRAWAQVLTLTPGAARALPAEHALRASAAYAAVFS